MSNICNFLLVQSKLFPSRHVLLLRTISSHDSPLFKPLLNHNSPFIAVQSPSPFCFSYSFPRVYHHFPIVFPGFTTIFLWFSLWFRMLEQPTASSSGFRQQSGSSRGLTGIPVLRSPVPRSR